MKKTDREQFSFEHGVLWMLISASFLSVSFLFLKINLEHFSYFFLLFLRFFVPLLFVAAIMTIRWQWKRIAAAKNIWLQLARCGCVLIAQYAIAFYISKNTLLNATVLLNA